MPVPRWVDQRIISTRPTPFLSLHRLLLQSTSTMGANTSAMFHSWIWQPKPAWSADEMPDLTEKVVVVTGANSGIGKAIAKGFLAHHAKVYLACKKSAKTDAVLEEFKRDHPGDRVQFIECDLASLTSIEAAAQEFLKLEPKLHILINNAGVFQPPIDMMTNDGYDLQFGVNCLGHWYLTELLLPALLAAATPTCKARVVTITSLAAFWCQSIDYSIMRDGSERRNNSPLALYSHSKMGNCFIARELARRHGDKIVSIGTDPGAIKSDAVRYSNRIHQWISANLFKPPWLGALTHLYAATAPEAEQLNGKFMIPWARVGPWPQQVERNPDMGTQLWEWCEKQVSGRR